MFLSTVASIFNFGQSYLHSVLYFMTLNCSYGPVFSCCCPSYLARFMLCRPIVYCSFYCSQGQHKNVPSCCFYQVLNKVLLLLLLSSNLKKVVCTTVTEKLKKKKQRIAN